MKALVTGGGGFIGSHVVTRLASIGCEVRVLDNFATAQRANMLAVGDEVELLEGDIQSYEGVQYVENVVEANLLAMDAEVAPGRVYNVACGESITLTQLGHAIEHLRKSLRSGELAVAS
jgi:nucleoside-diphosphate-sugar epimerase